MTARPKVTSRLLTPAPAAGTRAYLDLLARDAPLEDLEAPVRAARAAGASPEVLRGLEEAKAAAHRVKALLDHRRRREAELAALAETAKDLAALRDVDSVLRAIVRRVRQLLRSDVAYLSLMDEERGDTYLRVTDGAVSARFQRVRLPMGAGLGGLVAQTATTYATSSYFQDERFRHTADIDGAVLDEGLVAIVGAPLPLGSEVIGVLFAADRRERRYAREEVALLASLATHAAVAIDNARRLQEARTALQELNATTALLRAHTEAVERAAEAHDRFADLVLRGGGVDDLAAALHQVLGGALRVLDADGHCLAAIGQPPGTDNADPGLSAPDQRNLDHRDSDHRDPDPRDLDNRDLDNRDLDPPGPRRGEPRDLGLGDGDAGGQGLADPDLGEAVLRSRATGRAVRQDGTWVVSATAGSEHLGTLVLSGRRDLEEADQRIFERAGLVTSLLLLFRRSVHEAANRVRGELVDDLLTAPDRDPDALRDRAQRLGADLDRPHAVLVLAADGVDRQRLSFAAAFRAGARGGLGGEHAGVVVLLLPDEDPGPAAQACARELGVALGRPVTVGGAGPAAGPAQLARAYAEARRCLTALMVLGRFGDGASSGELGFVGLLLGTGRDVPGYVSATLGPVLDYDARRGTDLLGTLEAFFHCGGNLARTKDELHVHVNTVTQRLDRIGQLLGADWQQPDRLLEVQLALRLHRLRDASIPRR